jgi:type I restriction enzyme M protein
MVNEQELKSRTKQFGLRVMKIVDVLPKTPVGRSLGNQLVRSGTSVGANYRSACRSRSKAEFIAKIGIVAEEADESAFWLELIIDCGLLNSELVLSLYHETEELTAIFTASGRTAKRSNPKSKTSSNPQSKIQNQGLPMLDSETKARIDSARDILVGKVPDPKSQVEQITIALIYKFMDDMDRQSEEIGGKATFFAGNFKKYRWAQLLDKRYSGHERLLLYAEGIEKMNVNKNIPQLFRDIFKGVFLPYRDPETLNLFLKEIDGFTYEHSERLGDAYEYLLNVLGTQGEAGQFRTPRHVIDFIVTVVDPKKTETVLDPACGTAGFLISAYKHILNCGSPSIKNQQSKIKDPLTPDERARLMTNFRGYDIAPDMVRLSRVNMYLHGFPNPTIHEYDALTSEERWDERCDIIMANPPFMTPKGGIRPHNRFSIKAKRSEVLFVDYIAEHLNTGGRAGVIVPEGIIFQSQNAYKALRKMLIENYLWAVVSLPAGVFNPYAGVKTSVLFLDRNLAKRTDEILFVKIENDGFDLGAQRRPIDGSQLPEALRILESHKKAQKTQEGKMALTVPRMRLLESPDINLSGDHYRVAAVRPSGKWPMIKIGDLCDLQNGHAFKPTDWIKKEASQLSASKTSPTRRPNSTITAAWLMIA